MLNSKQNRPSKKKPLLRIFSLDDLGQGGLVSFSYARRSLDLGNLSGFDKTRRITEYELNVLSLKMGDVVKVEGQTFKLGEFLGFGNNTHVFALEKDDTKVIRIPAISIENSKSEKLSGIEKIMIARRAIKSYLELSKWITVPKADVLEASTSNYFVISTRVHGTLNARAFIEQLSGEAAAEESFYKALDTAQGKLNPSINKKITALLKLNEFALGNKGRALIPMNSEGKYYELQMLALHRLIWDEKLEQWTLVDWDKFEAFLLGSAISF